MSNVIKINNITIEDINYTNGLIQLNGEITLTINGTEETYTIQDGKHTLKTTDTEIKTEELRQQVETEPREAISHSRNVARQATININDVVEGLKKMFQQEQPQPQESKKISLDFNNLNSKQLAEKLNAIFNPTQ